jgi:hypothetical protein
MTAARSTFLTPVLFALCFSGCAALEKSRSHEDVEYSAGGSARGSMGANEAKTSPAPSQTRNSPALPTEQSATDSQSAMSQSASDSPGADHGDANQKDAEDVSSQVYPIPSGDKSEGEIKVIALGMTDLKIRGDDRNRVSALHIRMEAKNEKSRADWNLDSRLQQIRFSGSGDRLRPLFVQADSQSLPFIKVPSGTTIEIDLFYALPKAIAPNNAPSFELNWTLLASDQTVANTTTFKRLYPESRTTDAYAFEKDEDEPPAKSDPASKGTPMMREWWQDPYGYATPGSPVFNSYQ